VPNSATLSASQLERFHTDGWIVMEGAFSPGDARAMQDAWWSELSDVNGIRRDDRATGHQPRSDLKRAKRDPIQNRIATSRVRGVLDDLLGRARWTWPAHWGRVLTTFPQTGPWRLPTRIWHSDSPFAWHREALNGVMVVSFIGTVAPRSGGTLIVSGSPQLLRRHDASLGEIERRRGDIDHFHRSHRWLSTLTGHAPSPSDRTGYFIDDVVDIDGARVRVVELTGEPGDMVFCHPSIVHCAAPNCGENPRFMRIAGLMTHEGRALRRGDRPA